MAERKFDYYYGAESERFSFTMLPNKLLYDKSFSKLAIDAKVLYSVMLGRMNLSRQNNWYDESNRAYIYFTHEEIMELIGCSKQTVSRMMKELKDFGLIESKRQGLGKPNIIYVKNFEAVQPDETGKSTEENESGTDADEDADEEHENYNNKSAAKPVNSTEVYFLDFKKSKNHTSRSLKSRLQEVPKLDCNYIYNSYIDKSNSITDKDNNIVYNIHSGKYINDS